MAKIRFNGKEITASEFIKMANSNAKYATRQIHNAIGIDFNSNAYFGYIKGTFTINSIFDACGVLDRNGWQLVTLTRETKDYLGDYRKRFHIATYTEKEGLFYNHKSINRTVNGIYLDSHLSLDTFYMKGDFEKARKDETTETIFILQNDIYLLRPEHKGYNNNTRCVFIETDSYHHNGIIKAAEYKNNPEVLFSCGCVLDVLDKSGYLIAPKRKAMREKATQRRKERERNEFLNSEFVTYINELKKRTVAIKQDLASLLLKAGTAKELEQIDSVLHGWFGLSGVYRSIDTYEMHIANKDYNSVNECITRFKQIMERIRELETKTVEIITAA